jgi:hypothetical protein
MQTDESNKNESKDSKQLFGGASFPYFELFALLFVICVFEYGYVKYVWLQTIPTIDLFIKICIQFMVLMPIFTALRARAKLKKKLKAGEISLAYASDLSSFFMSQLFILYLIFMFLVGFARR